jgi:CheY-like chemotaxis protein
MLAFARQQDLTTGSADLEALVLGMRELLERTLGSNVELRFDIAPDLPSAQVDANQVELAILNLAINSRDAMPDGGRISIAVGQATSNLGPQMQPSRYLWIKVSDTGAGMDAKTLQMAVEPFFSTKPLGKGTGLGLSMVHGLAVQLGGALELTSTVGIGTSATLWLPIAAMPAKPAMATQETVPIASTNTARILVVDDDPLIAMSTVDMLEDLGHTVIRANSGKRALELLESEQAVDVLMTDHAMPGMTGVELADIARRKWPNLRVLLATGYADLPRHEKTDLPRLSKPYHQAQLQAEINRLLADQQ